ncbi:MAG: transporter permease [Firmicutes bacterium]|nr:transporter permease [Bacillota bacterium]
MSLALLALFLGMMVLGIPLAIAMGISSVVVLFMYTDIPLNLMTQSMFSSMNSFIMVAVPLFILSGILMDEGGVADKIFRFANALLGWSRGGLGNVTVFSSVIFAGMSGSSVADVASVGRISISAMTKNGYPLGYATALALTTSMLATIIPPSILMVIAASVANVSIGQVLFAGIIPGVLIAVIFMLYNYYVCRKNNYGTVLKFSARELRVEFLNAIPALLTPAILLGGMLSGHFTPTEAAGIAVLYTLAVSLFVYKSIKWRQLPEIFIRTVRLTGTILFIAVTAKPAGWIFEYDGLPGQVATAIGNVTQEPILIMLIIYAFFVIVGMFMDATAAIYIVTPILLPTILKVGIDPVYFIVFMVITLAFGLVTPPVGVCLYAAVNMTGLKFEEIVKASIPWMIITAVALIIFVLFPQLITVPVKWFFA